LDRSWGLARGFDFYDDAFSPEAFANRDLGLVDRRAGESVDHALAWLKKNPRRPFFFCFISMIRIAPTILPSPTAANIKAASTTERLLMPTMNSAV